SVWMHPSCSLSVSSAAFSFPAVENSDDDADERSSEEYHRDLELEFHERALLENSKHFIKRKNKFSSQKENEDTECYKCGEKGHFARNCFSKMSKPSYKSSVLNFSSVSKVFQPKFTPKLIQSSQHTQSSQSEPKFQKDYKAEYKKLKAKLALLMASPSTSQSPKPFQSKNKGLVAEMFDWDKEEVFDDEEMTQVKVLMALADDELAVGKNHACNGEWIDITMRKRHIMEPIGYLNSGCSKSMTCVKSYMHKYVEQPGPKFDDKQGTIFNANKEIVLISSRRNDVYVLDMSSLTLNGASERKNRTLIEAARTMLNSSVLAKQFWTEAVRIACYTQNRSIFIKRHDKTPYQIFRERIPDISYFHVMEAIRFTNTSVDEIGIDDSFRYPPDEFIQEDNPSRQYQANLDFSYYIISHGCLLTELIIDTHVLEVTTPNEQNIPHTEDVKGPPNLINTKGNQEQEVQNELINSEPTEEASGNNTETSIPITDPLVYEAPQSQIIHHASTRWVDAMQEELNQFYRNKVWTLVPLPYGKIAIGYKWVFRNKKGELGTVVRNKARLEFLINFTVKNDKKPLTLDYKTFCESIRLDYNNGQYVDHPSTEVVKAKLAKIATNEALVRKTLVLKTSFPVAWRIMASIKPPSEKVPTEDFDKTSQSPWAKLLIPKIQRETHNPLLKDSILHSTRALANQSLCLREMDEEFPQSTNEETQHAHSTKTPTKEPISTEHQSPSPNRDHPESSKDKTTDVSNSKSSSLLYAEVAEDTREEHEEAAASYAALKWSIDDFYRTTFKQIENTQANIQFDIASLKKDTFEIKDMMTEIFCAFKGQPFSASSSKTPSHTEGFKADMETEEKEPKVVNVEKEPEHEDTEPIPITLFRPTTKPTLEDETKIIGSSSRPQLTDPIVKVQIPKPETSLLTPKPNRRKGMARDTNELPRKLVKSSTKVHPDPDAPSHIPFEINGKLYHLTNEEIQAHYELEERQKKAAKEVKLLALKVMKKKSFDVYKPFRFGDFGVTEWDELNDIIPKKKNKVVDDLMNSVNKKYERLRTTPDELGIKPTLSAPGQVLSLT
ncbi:retrovirus-related pol polyprotein from transposon TNT 1-94, partial [Tanacetum coccineum]